MWMASTGNHRSSFSTGSEADFNHLDDDIDDEAVDPRVQDELEKLNNSTDAINKLEVDLDDARAAFRQLLVESSQRLNSLAKKLGSCVDKSRPYYDAKIQEKKAHAETQKAALRFERANSALAVAKEMVFSAEERLQKDKCTFDPAWQEMMNHATIRVNEAERERNSGEQEHKRTSKIYNESEQLVKTLKKELRSNIAKASLSARRNLLQLNDLAHQHQLLLLPYFEMKAQFNKKMEEKKRQVEELEEGVLKSKLTYAEALHNLEFISDEIHQKRKANEERRALGTRESGVGAENPEPANSWENSLHKREMNTESESTKENKEEWSVRTPIQKSRSTSTLSQIVKMQDDAKEEDDEKSKYMNRLRKSKSVMERTRAGPLFGRYSVSRNNKLHVDHSCQTEEILKSPNEKHHTNATHSFSSSLNKISEDIRGLSGKENTLNIPAFESVTLTPTCGSEVSSPMSTASLNPEGADNEPSSPIFKNDYEPSDSESQLSSDGLSDDQIASLMLDAELEMTAQNITQFEEATKAPHTHGMHNQTTQTTSIINTNNAPSLIK